MPRRLGGWLDRLFRPKPLPGWANALYFGIVEFEGGRSDFRCAALAGRQRNRHRSLGLGTVRFQPEPEYAGSEVLAALARANGPVRDPKARHVFCLGYVALVAARLARARKRTLAPRAATIAAGYDEGDIVVLGKLLPSGAFKPPPPPRPPKRRRCHRG